MNKLQRDVLIGCCLGDISIQITSKSEHTARFQISQAKRFKEYVYRKFEVFEDLCKTAPRINSPDRYPTYYFNTLSRKDIFEEAYPFFSGGVRGVPYNIKKLLTEPISLAYWFMDDGTSHYVGKRFKTSTIQMCTDRYTPHEVDLLIDTLRSNFNIKSSVRNSKCMGKRCRIYIGTEHSNNFYDIVKPFISQSMEYKLKYPID